TPSAVQTGTHTITGTYGGWSVNAASSGTFALSVATRSTSTTVTRVPLSVVVAQSTTCIATVTDTQAGGSPSAPSGTVTFSSSGNVGLTSCRCMLCSSVGSSQRSTVKYTPSDVGTGTHTITDTYGVSSVDTGSSGSFALSVT